FILLAPMIGLLMGMTIAVAVTWAFHRTTPRRVDKLFRRGQLLSAAFYSLGHGGNDAQQTMRIIFLLLIAADGANPSIQWKDRFVLEAPLSSDEKKNDVDRKKLERPPPEVLRRLGALEGKKYSTEAEFDDALRMDAKLSEAEVKDYRKRIVK